MLADCGSIVSKVSKVFHCIEVGAIDVDPVAAQQWQRRRQKSSIYKYEFRRPDRRGSFAAYSKKIFFYRSMIITCRCRTSKIRIHICGASAERQRQTMCGSACDK